MTRALAAYERVKVSGIDSGQRAALPPLETEEGRLQDSV